MSTVNVLRYSAFGLGLFFGLQTDIGLKKAASKKQQQEAYDNKMKLVEEAKAEYAKLNPAESKEAAPASKAGEIKSINLEDPNADFGSVILQAVDSLKN